jgi:DNA mismatch repair protein MutL
MDCGMSPGTEIIVNSLFHSVPARRKFMKTDRTESAHILQMCRLLAVAHPEVAFSLVEDGHEVFRTPACPDRLTRVLEIFGKRRVEDLLPIEAEQDGIRLSGLIGRPGVGRSTRSELITYVNQRPVDSRLLSYALIESYHRFLPRGRYPVAFLFVDVPSDEVDVNVHPTKREVRFRNEPRIRSAVMMQLTDFLTRNSRQALRQAEPVDPAPPRQVGPDRPPSPSPAPAVVPPAPRPTRAFPEIKEKPFAPVTPLSSTEAPHASGKAVPPAGSVWRFCGVFRKQVGLFESPDGLILLNARAACERILFERIEASLSGESIPRQPLLIPAMLEMSPLDAGVMSDQIPFFDSMGFEVEPFGRHLFRIRSVPAWLRRENPEAFVEELVHRIRERGIRPDAGESARKLVARLAAVREARGFSPAAQGDWESLAKSLLACENPLLDARGRPAFVEMRHSEIARKLMLDAAGEESEDLDGGR